MKLVFRMIALAGLNGLVLLAVAQQTSFDITSPPIAKSTLLTPAADLNVLSSEHYTALRHPLYPHHGVRIKKSRFCDTTVNAYTGYVDVGAKHLFFYFFESRSDPAKDDVIMWTNGGPGCSSAMGLFLELGPCSVTAPNETTFNPHAWNANANVFFIDQPVGVGFSYADFGETVFTTEEAAVDIAAFMAIFFESFSQFKGRAFHLSGESYAGRYLPLYASAIHDNNAALEAAGYTPIKLASVIIGNGGVDQLSMLPSYYEVQCTQAITATPVQSIKTCIRMKEAIPRCLKSAKASCVDQFDMMDCGAASTFCFSELMEPYYLLGLDAYDMTHRCDDAFDCYPARKNIEIFLNSDSTRQTLGVSDAVRTFAMCNHKINHAFMDVNLDHMRPTTPYISELLNRGVRVLIYNGANDYVSNWIGEERWLRDLEWAGRESFAEEVLRGWTFDGKVAGLTRGRDPDGLVFATIHGAGHLVPTNKPRESLAMLQRWLAHESL